MNSLAKWAWISFLAIIYLGWWFFVLLGLEIIALILIAWLKLRQLTIPFFLAQISLMQIFNSRN